MDRNLRRVVSQTLRGELLEWIGERPSSSRELAKATGEPLSKMTYHTAVLNRSGCIRARNPECEDPADRVYEIASLARGPRLPLSDSTRCHAISSILRRIVEKGRAALQAGILGQDGTRLSCESILLDEQGLREAYVILDHAAEQIAATRSAAAKRLTMTDGKRIETTIALAVFKSPRDEKPSRR